ncbi:hypothetical protein HMPREF1986_00938 [Oribacterium sp. oral taxon 078 str. F0263]|nr:hypothetical protein HMPREF1986_00938 [Oribacterium sp. oral taxon 078 str. F0263]
MLPGLRPPFFPFLLPALPPPFPKENRAILRHGLSLREAAANPLLPPAPMTAIIQRMDGIVQRIFSSYFLY